MQIKTLTYRRIKNLGNYQSETIEVTAELDEADDLTEKFEQLRTWTLTRLGELPSENLMEEDLTQDF